MGKNSPVRAKSKIMSILQFERLSHSYGWRDIFDNLSGNIHFDDKIGVVGANGTGKSTLLKVLAGLLDPSGGKITRAKHIRVGYLHQEAMHAFRDEAQTLYSALEDAFADVVAMGEAMRQLEHAMSESTASDKDITRYGELQDEYTRRGGYEMANRLARTLVGLGFAEHDWQMPVAHLSGGQKTRALLGRLLLQQPDLLILDEPTNHLDEDAVVWLESTLKVYDGAVMVVSHDRYFLNTIANHIWEMAGQTLITYRGNYSDYVRQRTHNHERTAREWERLMREWWEEYNFIEKQTLASPNAVGRFKRLAREAEALQQHGMEAIRFLRTNGWAQYTQQYARSNPAQTLRELRDVLNSIPHPLPPQKSMRLELEGENSELNTVLTARHAVIGYEEKELLRLRDARILQGDVVGLVGDNGTGKTTLLKTIMRDISPLRGRILRGKNVRVGYFAQAHETLDNERTVLDEFRLQTKQNHQVSRNMLARYLFAGEDVFKQVGDLSGGERARLALAILAQEGANFLVLDEPTNHLDVPAQEVLQNGLANFEGTILLVSHDRYLLDALCTHIWAIEGGEIRIYEGGYRGYLAERSPNTSIKTDEPTQDEKPKPDAHKQRQIEALQAQVSEYALLLSYAKGDGGDLRVEYERLRQQLILLGGEEALPEVAQEKR
jgi:ATP-binding cassette subfamily F protein 3